MGCDLEVTSARYSKKKLTTQCPLPPLFLFPLRQHTGFARKLLNLPLPLLMMGQKVRRGYFHVIIAERSFGTPFSFPPENKFFLLGGTNVASSGALLKLLGFTKVAASK